MSSNTKQQKPQGPGPRWKQWLWFVGFYIASLVVIGGFMFLCEIHPREIYRWFMSLFVDSYDWVMVPNAYAMSQNSAGGLITTKPYFSGSAYVRKMSHYKTGDWCTVWDGLYWRWIEKHSKKLRPNPRWAMMCAMAERNRAKNAPKVAQAEEWLMALANSGA